MTAAGITTAVSRPPIRSSIQIGQPVSNSIAPPMNGPTPAAVSTSSNATIADFTGRVHTNWALRLNAARSGRSSTAAAAMASDHRVSMISASGASQKVSSAIPTAAAVTRKT